ncbi:MAG TPA: hypothetical protein VJ725_25785 [Thermoanaerobaculia bacterium]|nr:hypothetical protein [Thermoanaerobaculia bacterium]
MAFIVRAFPVLPGKEEDMREFAAEMAGPRRRDAERFYKSFGVLRESWHYQETPHGPMVVAVTEVDADPGVRAQEYAESTQPFDSWFKEQVCNLTGIDPTVQPLGPPSEVIFDMRSELADRDRK